MAERRMFAKTIIDSDTFLDLPATTQLLYFHLGMRADDDGFVDKPRSVMRMIGGSKNDLDLLFAKQFLIPFESGVVVIKHWKIHNYIRKDRYSETIHLEEKAALLTAENGVYTIGLPNDNQRSTIGIPMVDTGKDRLGKDSIGEDRESTAGKPPTPARKEFSRYGWVKLTQEEYDRLVADLGEAEAKRCIDYIDEAAQSTRNKNKWRDWNLVVRRCHRDGWGKNTPPQGGRGSQMPDYGGADNWILSPIMEAAERANPAKPGDYGKNGLLYCGACHTPKQSRLNFLEREVVVSCLCACESERYAQEEAQRRQQEEADRIMRLRSSGITSQEYRNARFELDDGQNPKPMATLRKYADKWEQFQADNIGLLLYGGVGTGKSYGAACIANELIDRRIPTCMENLSSIMNTLGGLQGREKNEYITDLMRYPLLILDDFGMERQTEYAMEQVFNVVDARYRSGQPLIVTTNLSLAELQNPPTREHTRIYDRILEMCSPVNFGNNGRRKGAAGVKMKRAAELLGNA